MSNEKKYWLAFSAIEGMVPSAFYKLQKYFTDLKNAWTAEKNDLLKSGLSEKLTEKIIHQRLRLDPSEIVYQLQQDGIKTVFISDQHYPILLKEIYNPPPILYYRGKLMNIDTVLAIVGTRKPSSFGTRITHDLVSQIAQKQVVIASGLAYGIDSLAHQATLEVNGCTWAVLGSGLNNIYPSANRKLAQNIIESGGAIISEYPPNMQPLRQNFPARNRLISGLARGTLVIEAPRRSGALITAYFALEQNREIFAVPNDVYQINAKGTNNLIKKGARVVTSVDDVLELFSIDGHVTTRSESILPDNQEEEAIINSLESGPQTVDQIIEKCKLDISTINSSLSLMEIAGKIKQIEPQTYILNQ
ncbi:DNA-processing protein DprA [Patescibacteria group bacterium]|nr:DNA-processing protein DprA [Patescibacteria group bacterium]MBU1891093.1 DNA-processing protein DprA [Patescibacteria group bacterium]